MTTHIQTKVSDLMIKEENPKRIKFTGIATSSTAYIDERHKHRRATTQRAYGPVIVEMDRVRGLRALRVLFGFESPPEPHIDGVILPRTLKNP